MWVCEARTACVMYFVHFVCVATCQSQDQIEEERERVNASIMHLEEELENCRDQGEQWRTQLETATQELHNTTQELVSICQIFMECYV